MAGPGRCPRRKSRGASLGDFVLHEVPHPSAASSGSSPPQDNTTDTSPALPTMVETSPDGRFRYVKGGSRGAAGTAYDTENGLLVGWNELNLRELPPDERSSMKRTIDLLQGLKHDHVLGVRRYWEASRAGPAERQSRALPWQSGETSAGEGERVVFLTTPCTTLEAFVDTKVEFLRWRVVKRWSRQILEALLFLHDQSPPVVHNTIYIDPSKNHLFVGGVCDIAAPPPATRSNGMLSSSESGGGGGGGPMNWGNKAWGLVSGGGMNCGLHSAAAEHHNHHRHVGKESDDQSAAPEEEEEEVEEEEEEDGRARDVRGFGTVVIEMILKGRLDPALAEDERFLEMLSVFSGWPESVVDLLRSCRAPINEPSLIKRYNFQRPSAEQLLRHPFLELGNDLDDEAVYGDPTLVAAAFAAVHGHGGFAHQLLPGASLPVPLCPARCGGGGGTTCSNTPTSSTDFAAWSSCGGGGAGHGHHTPSCVSTESPSPSSPSAAPSFGGVPTVPSSPAMAAAVAMSAAVGPFASQGGLGPYTNGGGGGGSGYEDFSSLLPAGVTPTAYANAKAIAARMQHAAHPYSNGAGAAPFHHPTNVYDDDGQGEERVGRNRSASAGEGMRSGGSRSEDTGIGGYGFGVSQREEGGGGSAAAAGRPRSASEDAVWDMLPSDESQCRRPFSVSAVEGRHGY
ncbi:conserved unknown protein [Ectocarpus siliculosus]|uniref:Protein kinase domain-containing protein n=1 Tax=Ectocarpus siliculosus TaxID=2880 RepID=D7FPS4_ECTSI|nr:conserved unknown protein [Ectocarpus siliculosus]|eukprot:CBJ30531.1 conserved unknown protein [Ectocarpus siliculosus]